jgi:opacity protein-like surface antigen
MLNKILFRTSALAVFTALTSAAQAAPQNIPPSNRLFFKPYIGADYQYTHVNYQDDPSIGISGDDIANDTLHGANVHIGARLHKYFGLEAGYLRTDNVEKTNILGTGIDSKVRIDGFNVDAMFYLPLSGKFELIATGGVSRLTQRSSFTSVGSFKETETKGRAGGGAQYWLTDKLNLRTLVRYQDADFDGDADGAITATAGINYQF